MALNLPQAMIDEMVEHAQADLPNECCGVILGASGEAKALYRATNIAASPFRYEIDPKDLLSYHKETWANDWDFMVIYHSHVASQAYPSPTDVRLAVSGTEPPFENYPGAYYVLVSLADRDAPVVRAYKIAATGEITEEDLIAV